MAYSAVDESLLLLEGAPPGQSARLSRRRRFVPLAVDRDGDVAATMFLRRGVSGLPWLHIHSFELTEAGWLLCGGGGSSRTLGEFDHRPTVAELGAPAVSHGGGGSARRASRPFSTGASGVFWAQVRTAVGVGALRVADRVVPVAEHGLAVVVWGDVVPSISVLDDSGRTMGPVSYPFR